VHPDATPGAAESGAYSVVVMAKYPAPGRVKTRLAHDVGAAGAARLSLAFLRDLEARLRAGGIPTTWACWPADARLGDLLSVERVIPQEGADLGERMAAAAGRVLAETGHPVVLLGGDVPHVPLETLQTAGRALVGGADVVLGPSEDGGYYLVGMRRVVPELFRDVAWGSAAVYAETVRRCTALGLRRTDLLSAFDVDTGADLVRLAGLIRDGAVRLPRTEEALAALRIVS
jgi:rSAM/selenodomain-associated transferase 1